MKFRSHVCFYFHFTFLLIKIISFRNVRVFVSLLMTNISVPPPLPVAKPPTQDSKPQKLPDESVYEPGHATELLTQSVQKLKVADAKDDFRIQASKIINSMLESRLNNQKNSMKNSKVTINNTTIDSIDSNGNDNGINVYTNVVNGKRLLASNNDIGKSISSNSSSGNSSCSASDRSASPPSPSAISNKSDIVGKLSTIPPPPPAMPAFHLNNKSVSPVRNEISNNKKNIAPNNTTTITDMKPISDNSSIVGTVQSRIGAAPAKPGVTFSPSVTQTHHDQDHHQRNGVAYRNKSPAELTAHARDRRSYIEQGNTNGFVQNQKRNSQTYAQQANAIAAKLQDGEHPSCCVCHVKIAR